MKPSEELMLLLELNGFDITKFKLKKQLEYEQSGNLSLYKDKKYADLIVNHYTFVDDGEYLRRNPLTYREEWGPDITSIDQFYVTHPDLEGDVTLGEFLRMDQFDDVHRESILYDILDGWVEEYREASITQMENLRQMIKLLPKKSRKYKKPSKILLLFSLLFALFGAFLYSSPDTLAIPVFAFLEILVSRYVEYLYDVPWYSFFGNVAIFLFVLYAVANIFFSRYIKDIRGEKNKRADKTFDKWERDMQNERLGQAGILEDYVDRVIKKPKKSELDIHSLTSPRILMDKLKAYVMMVERKYDIMTKYYKTFIRSLRWLYVIAFLTYVVFLATGFAMMRGWI